MRELTFGLDHERGHSQLMDVFHEHVDLRMRSVVCSWQDGTYWRVDRAGGSSEALDALDSAYLDDESCHDCLVNADSVRNRTCETFARRKNDRLYYNYWEIADRCVTVPELAMEHFGPGTLLQSFRRDGEHWWKVVVRSDQKVGMFYDSLQAELPAAVAYVLGHLTDVQGWEHGSNGRTLTAKQQAVIEAAVDLGYYETPRRASQTEVAAELDLPRSTVSYRLRRAESVLANTYVDDDGDDGWQNEPDPVQTLNDR